MTAYRIELMQGTHPAALNRRRSDHARGQLNLTAFSLRKQVEEIEQLPRWEEVKELKVLHRAASDALQTLNGAIQRVLL